MTVFGRNEGRALRGLNRDRVVAAWLKPCPDTNRAFPAAREAMPFQSSRAGAPAPRNPGDGGVQRSFVGSPRLRLRTPLPQDDRWCIRRFVVLEFSGIPFCVILIGQR